jgi:hypothetical protein
LVIDIPSFTTTPTDGTKLEFHFKTPVAAATITWTGGTNGYISMLQSLITQLTINKNTFIFFEYDSSVQKWHCLTGGTQP